MLDPLGVIPRGVEYVHWRSSSARHPDTFSKREIAEDLLKAIQISRKPPVETIGFLKMSKGELCTLNGQEAPCFLFARKFSADAVPVLSQLQHVLGY